MIGRRIPVAAIRLYQRGPSRLLGARCRFHPSCSEYAAQAIEANGVLRGGGQALWRVVRCGPWSPGGVDQVKTRGDSQPSDG